MLKGLRKGKSADALLLMHAGWQKVVRSVGGGVHDGAGRGGQVVAGAGGRRQRRGVAGACNRRVSGHA